MTKLVRWILDDLKLDRIALIYVNDAFGKGGRDIVNQYSKARGKTLAADLSTAILLVEQNAYKALDIADYGYVMELGVNRYEGAAAMLRTDERIKRLYLGGR